ncbi:hypothetical protein EV426DRAFT_625571, partial [Tirmania nivea]
LYPLYCTSAPDPLIWVHAHVCSIIPQGADLTSWFLHYVRGPGNISRLYSIVLFEFITWSYIHIMQFMY